MAFITDPDFLNQGVEVTINTTTRRITLNAAGNLGDAGSTAADNGATGQAIYSFLKEEWRTDPALIPFPFPMVAITPEQFEFVNDWEPADDATRNLIRTAGWREIAAGGAVKREYLSIITLGNIGVANTPYFALSSDTTATDFNFPGPVNQSIQTFGDATNGNFDQRTDVLTVYIRTQGNTYAQATSVSIGVPSGNTLDYITRRFPLSEAVDSNIVANDNDVDTLAPYTGMSIEYFALPQNRTIGASSFDFSVIVDGNNGTFQEIYTFVQRQLRLNSDIDAGAGTVIGQLADALIDTDATTTLQDSQNRGVFIDNFNSNDTNILTFTDDTGAARQFPFVSAGSIVFNTNLQLDPDAVYFMFFTTNPTGNFGTSTAVIVQDNSSTDIQGNVSGASSISFDFDYDGNSQGGRTPATDADVTIVAIGLNGAQYVVATGTITRAVGQNFSLVAPLERNYANAA